MILLRAKQMVLAIFLMGSLLSASPAACLCSSHKERPATAKSECHSHSGAHEGATESETGSVSGHECTCVLEQRAPSLTAKQEKKETKAKDAIFHREHIAPQFAFNAVGAVEDSSPFLAVRRSYSRTQLSLLPSRAPPRL